MDTIEERHRLTPAPFQARVIVTPQTQGASAEANTLDISPAGVHLICSEPLVAGEDALLTFEIKIREEVLTEEVWGRALHVQMDDDVWVVGLEFTQVLDRQKTPQLAEAAMSGGT
jgi:hypothetical protein